MPIADQSAGRAAVRGVAVRAAGVAARPPRRVTARMQRERVRDRVRRRRPRPSQHLRRQQRVKFPLERAAAVGRLAQLLRALQRLLPGEVEPLRRGQALGELHDASLVRLVRVPQRDEFVGENLLKANTMSVYLPVREYNTINSPRYPLRAPLTPPRVPVTFGVACRCGPRAPRRAARPRPARVPSRGPARATGAQSLLRWR